MATALLANAQRHNPNKPAATTAITIAVFANGPMILRPVFVTVAAAYRRTAQGATPFSVAPRGVLR